MGYRLKIGKLLTSKCKKKKKSLVQNRTHKIVSRI